MTQTHKLLIAPLLFGAIFICAQLLQTNGVDLRLLSNTLSNDEWYRLITGNLVHTNWAHLGMNLAALLITVLLFPLYSRLALLSLCALWDGLIISLGILLLFPHIAWYAGFSGIVHGLLMTGAILNFRELVSKILLLLLIAKVGWEIWSGGDSLSASLIEAPVVYESHFLGLIAGALISVPLLYRRRT